MKAGISYQAKAVSKLIAALLLLLLWNTGVNAQDLPLNRNISVDFQDKPLAEGLFIVGRTGQFNISYNSRILHGDSIVSLTVTEMSARNALKRLLGENYHFETLSNHVIIKYRKPPKPEPQKPLKWRLHGHIIDAVSHEPMVKATIYEDSKGRTALTDSKGNFEIELPWTEKFVAVSISKIGYRDTVVVIRAKENQYITQGMEKAWPDVEEIPTQAFTGDLAGPAVEDYKIVRVFVPQEQRTLTENILSRLRRVPVQFSLIPGISTSGLLSGGMDNVLSVNLIAGYANGVRGLEMGGMLNIDREHVYGLQAAGFGNFVGGNMKGLQAAGFANVVQGNGAGLQGAGFANLQKGDFQGLQASGFANLTDGAVEGLQAAGFANLVDSSFSGLQAAGFANLNGGNFNGMQSAGFMNINRGNFRGMQSAGFMNIAPHKANGFQAAGFANYAKSMRGLQVSGFINYAQNMKGMQIGIVNVSDTLKGTTIGLANISKTGYMRVEASYSELFSSSVKFKSGSHGLYFLWGMGTSRLTDARQDGYFAGFGSHLGIGRLFLELEAQMTHVAFLNNNWVDEVNFVFTGSPTLGFRVAGPVELIGGVTFNGQLSERDVTLNNLEINATPTATETTNGLYYRTWMGWKAGVQVNLNGTWRNEKFRKHSRDKEKESETDPISE